jgi:hypothetical protein
MNHEEVVKALEELVAIQLQVIYGKHETDILFGERCSRAWEKAFAALGKNIKEDHALAEIAK